MGSVIWCARQHLKVQIVGLEVRGKNARGRACAAITGSRARRGASVWSAASVPALLGFTPVGARRSVRPRLQTSIRLLAGILFLTASELELAHRFTRRRPKPDRACAAAALRSCVE